MSQSYRFANSWRKRGLADGCIDGRMAVSSIHNLDRGLTRPYIGAHFEHNDQLIKVWQTEIERDAPCNLDPGKILEVSDRFLIIKAGIGAIRILEYDSKLLVSPGSYT